MNNPHYDRLARLTPALLGALALLTLGNGCMTPAVVGAATNRKTLTDRIDTVERAYVAPDGRVEVCLTGSFPSTAPAAPYTVRIAPKAMTPPVADPATRQMRVSLPRDAVQKGWPSPQYVAHHGLRRLPVLNEDGAASDATLRGLHSRAAEIESVVAFRDPSQGSFAYLHGSPAGPQARIAAFQTEPHQTPPAYYMWVLLPPALAADVAGAAAMLPLALPAGIVLASYFDHVMH